MEDNDQQAEVIEAPVVDLAGMAELDAALPAIEQMLLAGLTAEENAYNRQIAAAPDEAAKRDLEREKRDRLFEIKNAMQQQLPQARAYAEAVKQVNKETGIPIKLLTMAKTREELTAVVAEFQKKTPAKAPAKAPEAVVENKDEEETPPAVPKVDSGVSTASKGNGETWRTLSPSQRVLAGLRR